MRLLVCGDRNWKDEELIKVVIAELKPDVVIEGGARGADTIAREVAQRLGITVEEYLAKWDEYGKKAGPIRNAQMIARGNPDMVAAFHDNITESRGTANMIWLAGLRKIPVKLFCHQGDV